MADIKTRCSFERDLDQLPNSYIAAVITEDLMRARNHLAHLGTSRKVAGFNNLYEFRVKQYRIIYSIKDNRIVLLSIFSKEGRQHFEFTAALRRAIQALEDTRPLERELAEVIKERGITISHLENETAFPIEIEIPEEIANRLESEWGDLAQRTLEALAIEAYRSNVLTTAQIQQLLNLPSRWDVDAFLKQHQIDIDYSETDLEQDFQTLQTLLPE
jgi:mRNA-degrading endonuclease RelE of RelBE toxin-antitoxin system/predicted HTH domain antitoxin